MATVGLYRAMLKATHQWTQHGSLARVRLPVHRAAVQWIRMEGNQGEYQNQTQPDFIRKLFPNLKSTVPEGDALDRSQLTGLIRSEFRAHAHVADKLELAALMDSYFAAFRLLTEQMAMAAHTSVTYTEGICVEASSEFRGFDAGGAPVFQYRIRICNQSDREVQLLGRQWDIVNRDGTLHASVPKNSPGVVGKTPVIEVGQCFEYASGTSFSDPTGGTVQGSFQVAELVADGDEFSLGRHFDVHVDQFNCEAE